MVNKRVKRFKFWTCRSDAFSDQQDIKNNLFSSI